MTIVHSLTSPELATLRSGAHWSILALAFPATPVVFACRVNQVITTRDKVYEITYDGVTTGAYTDVIVGQTLWVGSSAGAYDVGMCRIRKSPSATKLYINETSEIYWADDLYLTVVDDFGLWVKFPYQNAAKTIYMDRDITYSDQHVNWLPIVNFGGDRVARLIGANAVLAFDASGSSVPGSSVSAYAWSVTGGTLSAPSSAATNLTLTTPGTYRITCTVTGANGKSNSGHRTVSLVAPGSEISQFQLESAPSWDTGRGGWEFGVQLWGQADITDVHDRQKVILYARDFYGVPTQTETSIGQVTGSENILAVGWIAGETIQPAPDGSSVSFEVRGAHYWLGQETASLIDLKNTGSKSAATWSEISAMTVDLALTHYLQWRTTAPLLMDCTLSGDTRQMSSFETPIGTTWEQMRAIAGKILAAPNCDQVNRLFVQIDPQYTPTADRGSIPNIMSITKPDWAALDLERQPRPACSRLELVGERWVDGGKGRQTLYSLANGHMHKRYGIPETVGEPVLASTQAQLNTLAGLLMAQRNNEYPNISIEMTQNNRGITGVPRQFLSLSVAADDTPRGVVFSGDIIPRAIAYDWNEGGYLITTISAEAAVDAEHAIKGDVPEGADIPDYPPTPPLPPISPPPDYPPTPEDPTITDIKNVIILTEFDGVWYTDEFDQDEPRWYSLNAAFGAVPLNSIFDIGVTPSGRIYVASGEAIWSGMWGDPPGLSIMVDQAWLDSAYPPVAPYYGTPYVGGFGVNLSASDQIAFFAGQGYLGTRTANIWIGNATSVTQGGDLGGEFVAGGGNIVFTGGKWVGACCTGVLFYRRLYTYSASGVLESNVLNPEDDGVGAEGARVLSGGGSVNLWGYSNGHLWSSTDNGVTRATGTFLPYNEGGRLNGGVDFHSSGVGMGSDETALHVLKATSDGINWATVLARETIAVCCVTPDIFIAGGGHFVEVTNDFGQTWVDKTGNLTDYLPTVDIIKIRVLL